jgi:hypothetical protein
VLSNIRIGDIDIIEGLRPKYHGMSLVCLLFESSPGGAESVRLQKEP